jgi:UDP-N-acetylglucosamine 2-epimerase (hydrolysing)
MDLTLAKTIEGISSFVRENRPDLIVVHGDRVEPLAGAVVGALNNILVAHIEGGEVSGTVDELLRHAVSKMSHIHFASNEEAKRRLMQLGEYPDAIWVIGSPDIDIMFSEDLPTIEDAKGHYDLEFDRYAIAAFHPVTTEIENLAKDAEQFVDALIQSGDNYIVIYPNNDLGSELILNAYRRLEGE